MKRQPLLLILVLLLGIALRLYNLEGQQIWGDEIDSLYRAQTFWTFFPSYLSYSTINDPDADNLKPPLFEGYGNQQPLYYTALSLWTKFFGTSIIVTRLFSALIGIFALIAFAFLANELFDARAALFATFLFAISPFHLYYTHELRGYAFMTLFTLLATLFYWRLIHKKNHRAIAGYAVSLAFLLLSHTHGFFILLFHWVHYLCFSSEKEKTGKTFFLANLGAFLLYLPWLPHFLAQLRFINVADSAYWYIFSWIDLPAAYVVFGLGQTLIVKESPLFFLLIISVFYFFSFCLPALYGLTSKKKQGWFLFLWLTIPVVLPWALSPIKPMYTFRYISLAAPALLLLVGEGYNQLAKKKRTFFVFLFLLATMLSLASVMSYEILPARQQSYEAAHYLAFHRQEEPIFVHQWNYQYLLRYYHPELPLIGIGDREKRTMTELQLNDFGGIIQDIPSFWVVYSATLSEEDIHRTILYKGFHAMTIKRFVGFQIYHYKKEFP